jgi:hypothetical protein
MVPPDRFTCRELRHPLELVAAMVARDAWSKGLRHEAVVRSAPERTGLRDDDHGTRHFGLFLKDRLVGYARYRCTPEGHLKAPMDRLHIHPDLLGQRVSSMPDEHAFVGPFACVAEEIRTESTPCGTHTPRL